MSLMDGPQFGLFFFFIAPLVLDSLTPKKHRLTGQSTISRRIAYEYSPDIRSTPCIQIRLWAILQLPVVESPPPTYREGVCESVRRWSCSHDTSALSSRRASTQAHSASTRPRIWTAIEAEPCLACDRLGALTRLQTPYQPAARTPDNGR